FSRNSFIFLGVHRRISALLFRRTPSSTLFPYTTLFRSVGDLDRRSRREVAYAAGGGRQAAPRTLRDDHEPRTAAHEGAGDLCARSEEHTSELQSRENLVCRLLLEKKKQRTTSRT